MPQASFSRLQDFTTHTQPFPESKSRVAHAISCLSAREYQILALACDDHSLVQIAARIYSDENMVRHCLMGIAGKMGLHGYEALVDYAKQHELFSEDKGN
jgi:DNA-binding CsgD family transcriptional regulator